MNIRVLPVGSLETNCYLVSDKNGAAVVIDPGAEADRILRMAERNGVTISAVLLTHGHYDHIGAVDEICEKTNAPLMIHCLDEEMLLDAEKNLSSLFMRHPFTLSKKVDRLLSEGDEIVVGELHFTVLHTPGHSNGSICFLCKEGEETVLFSGDTLFYLSYGRTDQYSGSEMVIKASLSRLAHLDYSGPVYCGHGPATDMAFERTNNPYLR